MDQQQDQNQSSSHNASGTPAAAAAQNNTILAAISYLGPLVIISYLMGKENDFVKFHAQQGLAVFILEIIVWILGSMIYSFWMVINILNLITLILSIIGIINAIQGKKKELPVIGDWAKSLNF